MSKKMLWLLIASRDMPAVHLALPTVAWMAESAGVDFECYLEAERDGRLFARTGSTVLGGRHHQQFNYLNAAFDVQYILLGDTSVFDSSIEAFGRPILYHGDGIVDMYRALAALPGVARAECAVFAAGGPIAAAAGELEIGPYLFPDVFYRRALGLPIGLLREAAGLVEELEAPACRLLFVGPDDAAAARERFGEAEVVDSLESDDDYGTLTLRIAERWKGLAQQVAFGDPDAILPQIPAHCRRRRIALYAPAEPLPPAEVKVAAYAEQTSAIATEVARLAEQVGNFTLVGRQTGDGDIFEWSRRGVAIQITDPNRPPFPVVSTLSHRWARAAGSPLAEEPDDAELERLADEGKVLTTLMWHSGEMAHNEAMLNVADLACRTGLKMGVGVHAARYETCPQLWELLSVPRGSGGMQGLIEPVLHSGGTGVLAEFDCPLERLGAHCREALKRIRRIAGDGAAPRGYYAFMDTDLGTLSQLRPELYDVIESCGLEYVISSATPGRNRIIHQTDGCIVLNQTPRVVCSASPFVRVTTVEELRETAPRLRPGWLIATLDAPVIAFDSYIWRHGSRFMQIVDYLQGQRGLLNVLPHTVSRYARILRRRGSAPLG